MAFDLAVDSGERHVQAAALNDLALTLNCRGCTDEASAVHRRALDLSTRFAHQYEQGRALLGLGDLASVTDPDGARRCWLRALAIFERMGVPERHEVRRRLGEGPS